MRPGPAGDSDMHTRAYEGIEPNGDCPCGSGNKYRFCCYGITGDLSDAIGMALDRNYGGALDALDEIKAPPGCAEVLGLRAFVHLMFDDLEDAENALEQAFAINPDYPRGHVVLSSILMEQERFAEAEAALRRALAFYPEHCTLFRSEALTGLGFALLEQKEFAGAKDAWVQALEMDPESVVIPSIILEHIYDNPDAPAEVSRKDTFYFTRLTVSLPEAFMEDEEEFELSPEIEAEVDALMEKAQDASRRKRYREAASLLENALELYPYNEEALMALHLFYTRLEDVEGAMGCLYDLAAFTENPEFIKMIAVETTVFELFQRLALHFPQILYRANQARPFHVLTTSLKLDNMRRALRDFEKSAHELEDYYVEKSQNGRVFIYYFRPNHKGAPRDPIFALRAHPWQKTAYVDSIIHSRAHEHLHIVRSLLGTHVTAEPAFPEKRVLFYPALRDEPDLSFSEEEDPEGLLPDFFDTEDGLPEVSAEPEFVTVDQAVEILQDYVDEFFNSSWLFMTRDEFDHLSPVEAATEEPFEELFPGIVDGIEQLVHKLLPFDNIVFDFNELRENLAIPPQYDD